MGADRGAPPARLPSGRRRNRRTIPQARRGYPSQALRSHDWATNQSESTFELHGGYGVTTDFPIQRIHRDCVTNVVAGGAPAVMRNGVAAGLFPHRKFPQT
ncbi:acyl-CoA dehydrogenase family protein [Rhodococcus opacus]|uniref:acyl-CoA dehydrogenase family protein n=1 Tax=Rhodococcus opacus TaxID=37919 RepID=UPI0034D210F8